MVALYGYMSGPLPNLGRIIHYATQIMGITIIYYWLVVLTIFKHMNSSMGRIILYIMENNPNV